MPDPVLDLPTPLVFAHRGGAREVPESTERAFRHALVNDADVLELDLRLTRDGEIVVWHGPRLEKAYIGWFRLWFIHITWLAWNTLQRVRVVDPQKRGDRTLEKDRRLLRLEEFIDRVTSIEQELGKAVLPWNIELKGKAERWKIRDARTGKTPYQELFELLRRDQVGSRKLVLAAAGQCNANALRDVAAESPRPRGDYAFNLTGREQLSLRKSMRRGLWVSLATDLFSRLAHPLPPNLRNRYALQTPHTLVNSRIVKEMHARGVAVHAILSPFPALSSGVDRDTGGARLKQELTRLVLAQVDGVMTDYPKRVLPVLQELQVKANAGVLAPVPTQARGVAWFGAATVIIGLCLLLLQSLLRVRDGWGIEDFLDWANTCVDATPFNAWARSRRAVAWVYLIVDSVAFVPVYATFALSVVAALRSNSLAPRLGSYWWIALRCLILTLVGVDLVENGLGLARFNAAWGSLVAVTMSTLSLLLCWRLTAPRRWLGAPGRRKVLSVAGALAALSVVAGSFARNCSPGELLPQIACGAHRAKLGLSLTTLVVLGLTGLAWLFGVDRLLLGGRRSAKAEAASNERQRLRAAIGDMLGRSRYVLMALVFVGVLTAGMDQGRDVLYAMAAWPFQQGQRPDLAVAAGAVFALATLAAATAALEYTCWLWTRSVCQIRHASSTARRSQDAQGSTSPLVSGFAKHWARALAFGPILCLVTLHARVVQDGAMADGDGDISWPIAIVFITGLAFIVMGVRLLLRHGDTPENDPSRYYSGLSWHDWCCAIGFWPEEDRSRVNVKYRVLFERLRVYFLPVLLGPAMFACRFFDVLPPDWPWQQDHVPSLALATVLFAVALWLCFFGWLSMLEVHQSVPWIGLLIVAAGFFGAKGWADNHVVWTDLASEPHASRWASLHMLLYTGALLLLVLVAYWLAIQIARARSRQTPAPHRRLAWGLGVVLLAFVLVLWRADHDATSRGAAIATKTSSHRRSLQQALGLWLSGLCKPSPGHVCGPDEAVPVYFVSTEGGGIRAAVWTAMALDRLAAEEHFLERTFSISGVSGGSVGAALFRACGSVDPAARTTCIGNFARTDLLSPLLSAWLFEDLLGHVTPTKLCRVPGCGVLSRGNWFEQGLESGADGLRRGLIASTPPAAKHAPYLLLNATWVESGERAIASDLVIDWTTFPGARDQLDIIGRDLSLATAAHNSARFPYINAIGSLHATPERCASRKAASPDEKQPPKPSALEPCGHLADGGYFDNSGGQSTLDVLRGFEACLTETTAACGLPQPQRDWLRSHLVPQVLMIRNGVEIDHACAGTCPLDDARRGPVKCVSEADGPCPNPCSSAAEKSAAGAALACPNPLDDGYHPDRPDCNPSQKAFIGLVGPVLGVVNVSGIGANGRLAEARQRDAVRELRQHLGGAAVACSVPPVRGIDLVPDGTLYPLGWHLSRLAIDGMRKQAAGYAPRLGGTPGAGQLR